MKQMKRWLSLMLAVLMVLSILPISAAAETETQSIPNAGLGDWFVPDGNDKIVLTDEGEYLAVTYDRSQVEWDYFAAPVTAENVGAGGIFSFTLDFGAERGYTDNFLVRLMYADGSNSELYPTAQEGKAVYTLTVPLNAPAMVTEVQIFPENPWLVSNYESQSVTVKLYETSLSVNTDTTGLGSWYTPADSPITLTDEGEYRALTYDRSQVEWKYIAAPATVAGIGAGGIFSFTLDFGAERGYTDNFLVRLMYADGSNSELWPAAQEGKAVYTLTVPLNAPAMVTEVQIFPENPWLVSNYESQSVTVKLYETSLSANTDTTGLGSWYTPASSPITLTDEGEYRALTYDRSQVQWAYIAAPATVAGVGAGGTFSFTLDFGAERGYTDNFLVRLIYADGKEADLWPAAQEGKAVYTLTVPQDATAMVTEVRIFPENPWKVSGYESKTVTVMLYDASLKSYISNVGLGRWYVPDWADMLTMADSGKYLDFTYDRSQEQARWFYFAASADAEGVSAGSTLTFTMDLGAERGYTDNFMVRLMCADGSNVELFPAPQEGKAEYTVTVPQNVTATVTEVQIFPENPYCSYDSQVVTVRLYQAELACRPLVYEGLNPLYYPSWWGEDGSWANDPINISKDNPGYMRLSYENRRTSATDWKCVVAEPSITASAGAQLTLDVEFEPERTGENFMVRFFSDNGQADDYVGITGKRGTYTITVPDTVQGTVTEIRIHPENPWAENLPDEASAMKLYSAVFAVKEEPGQVDEYNLILDDNISVNFYLNLSDSFLQSAGAALKVTVDGTASNLPIPEANENGQYVFSVDVAAAQMTAPIVLQLVSDDLTGEEWSYCVIDFANKILSGSYSDAAKALVRAMLDYGGKAQTCFGYRTDVLANADLTDLPDNTMPDASGYGVNISGSVTGLHFYGASLLFQSRVAIRYYFALTGDDAVTDYRFTVGSQECTPVQAENGLYYVEVTGITPQLMDAEYTVTAAKADSDQSVQVTYSCMSYITRMYAKQTSSEALKALLKAMYEYSLAAKSYLASL